MKRQPTYTFAAATLFAGLAATAQAQPTQQQTREQAQVRKQQIPRTATSTAGSS